MATDDVMLQFCADPACAHVRQEHAGGIGVCFIAGCGCQSFHEAQTPAAPAAAADEAAHTAAPGELREATGEEAKLIEHLARVIGWALVQEWERLPVKGGANMTLAFCAALAHNFGRMLASAPQTAITEEQWTAWVEQNVEMLRQTAAAARTQRVHLTEVIDVHDAAARGKTAPAWSPLVPQPKFVM